MKSKSDLETVKLSSYLLVAIQFACLGCLLWFNRWPNTLTGAACWMLSLLILAWVAITPGARRLRIVPEPAVAAVLMTKGPYHYVRHPLYSAVILFALGCFLDEPLGINLPLLLILIAVLVVKMNREEEYLQNKFADYNSYIEKSKRLLPFLY